MSDPLPAMPIPPGGDESGTPVSADDASRVDRGEEGRVVDRPGADRDAYADMDEDELVLAARTDREAFGVLYDRFFDPVYHYIARRVERESIAEDISAAVWERVLRSIERYELRGVPFAAYLYRVAGNQISNHRRRARLLSFVPFEPRHGPPSKPTDRADDRAALRAALGELSEADQEVLGLCYFAGLSPQEIANVLDCSVAAVHKRLHRARGRLRRELEGESHAAASA